MELNLNNITFIIVSFKSHEVIDDCLKTLPEKSRKLVIENSKNIRLKKELELKYDNIEVIINENLGMGASNNIGISMSKTDFVYILNPDTKFEHDTFKNLVSDAKKIKDFAILSPLCSNKHYPNYKVLNPNKNNINDMIIEVDTIDGFSMLINKSKFNKEFFDENIFLYLENDDICLRARNNNQKIYILKNSLIDHLGSSSSLNNKNQFEYLRNWHWMWSKYYFNKKHYGTLNSFIKVMPNLFTATLKFILNFLLFNTHKKKIYKMRISGLINSILGRKSFFRVDQ